jgi:predicted transcriptional regulator
VNTADAVREVLRRENLSKYRLAKELRLATSSSINQYLRGTRMSESTAQRFFELYGIAVHDTFHLPNRVS